MKNNIEDFKRMALSEFPPLMGPLSSHIHGVLVVDSQTGEIFLKKI